MAFDGLFSALAALIPALLLAAGIYIYVALVRQINARVPDGTILLLAAYPLIFLAEMITQRLSRGDLEKQGIIELFNSSATLQQRIWIIIIAVAVAPIAEEFFFRFFLYGVLKQYLGRGIGVA